MEYYLAHHGIKGQKWGIRRYQNADGTLTAEGRQRYLDNEKLSIGLRGIKPRKKLYSDIESGNLRNNEIYKRLSVAYSKAADDINETVANIQSKADLCDEHTKKWTSASKVEAKEIAKENAEDLCELFKDKRTGKIREQDIYNYIHEVVTEGPPFKNRKLEDAVFDKADKLEREYRKACEELPGYSSTKVGKSIVEAYLMKPSADTLLLTGNDTLVSVSDAINNSLIKDMPVNVPSKGESLYSVFMGNCYSEMEKELIRKKLVNKNDIIDD